jgi:hypothetical protein
VSFYTRALPTPIAQRRIDAMDADLHDHIAHERTRGTTDRRIALGILSWMARRRLPLRGADDSPGLQLIAALLMAGAWHWACGPSSPDAFSVTSPSPVPSVNEGPAAPGHGGAAARRTIPPLVRLIERVLGVSVPRSTFRSWRLDGTG